MAEAENDILATAPALRELGVRVFPTDRGGRATYHGPGQLVIYLILRPPDGDLHAYVWRLEETAIRMLNSYGLEAQRVDGHPGVWMASSNGRGLGNKIAAVGLAVRDGITRHGLALNVTPEMAHFELLIPCGNADAGVTSMASELGWTPDLEQVAERFRRTFGQVFACKVMEGQESTLMGHGVRVPEQPAWLWRRTSPQVESAVDRMERLFEHLGRPYRLPGSPLPQYCRVFWPRHGDLHDPWRLLQPGLSFLRREAG